MMALLAAQSPSQAQAAASYARFVGGPTTSRVPEPARSGPKDPVAWKQAQDFEQMFLEQTLGQQQWSGISDDIMNSSVGPVGRAVNNCHNS